MEDEMSIFGGISPMSIAAEAALGVETGGISVLAEMAAQQVMLSASQQIVAQLGQESGLSQSIISTAQDLVGGNGDSLSQAISSYGEQAGLSTTEQGSLQNEVESIIQGFVQQSGQSNGTQHSGKSSGSWLVALAEALGKVADQQADKVTSEAGQLTGQNDKPSDVYRVQGDSQLLNLEMSSFTDVIKTLGEALGQAANKN